MSEGAVPQVRGGAAGDAGVSAASQGAVPHVRGRRPHPADPRIFPLSPSLDLPARVIGAKARGLVELMRLGLPVPQAFVICGSSPSAGDLRAALRNFSVVSVRSGAAVSMPGMMDTVLNVPIDEVPAAVARVFSSWDTPRAVTYRELHSIPHDLGTAVVVQEMVYGDRDSRSGSGVAFSRSPSTGDRAVFGEVLFGAQGSLVVSGETVTLPLGELESREPGVWVELVSALEQLERHYRDVCHVEFTFESGRLWFLQVRPGGLVGRAAVRAAVDLVDEGVIEVAEAVGRISDRDLRLASVPRIRLTEGLGTPGDAGDGVARGSGSDLFARGQGASPGVAAGRVAVTADSAVRMAAEGPVILVRPHTSPLDMHGLAVAAGIVTSRGGPTSHAAVVARSMGKPAVVGAIALTVDAGAGRIQVGDRVVPEGTFITIDGSGGEVMIGDPGSTTGDEDPHLARLLAWKS